MQEPPGELVNGKRGVVSKGGIYIKIKLGKGGRKSHQGGQT